MFHAAIKYYTDWFISKNYLATNKMFSTIIFKIMDKFHPSSITLIFLSSKDLISWDILSRIAPSCYQTIDIVMRLQVTWISLLNLSHGIKELENKLWVKLPPIESKHLLFDCKPHVCISGYRDVWAIASEWPTCNQYLYPEHFLHLNNHSKWTRIVIEIPYGTGNSNNL